MKNLVRKRIYSSSIFLIQQVERVKRVSYHRFFASIATPTTSNTAAKIERPRRRKVIYEKYNDAKLATSMMATTTSLEDPFQYSGDSIDDYKKLAELSPWVPVPDSVARKIFDRAIPEHDDGTKINKEDEVSIFYS